MSRPESPVQPETTADRSAQEPDGKESSDQPEVIGNYSEGGSTVTVYEDATRETMLEKENLSATEQVNRRLINRDRHPRHPRGL